MRTLGALPTLRRQYVVRLLNAPISTVGVESGFGNWMVETGIVRLILSLILGVSIAVSAWKVVVKLKGTPWFPLSFVIFFFSALLLFPMSYTSFSTYQGVVINSNLWLLLGILFQLKSYPSAFQAHGAARALGSA